MFRPENEYRIDVEEGWGFYFHVQELIIWQTAVALLFIAFFQLYLYNIMQLRCSHRVLVSLVLANT